MPGESQSALQIVQSLRRLLACDGWHDTFAIHLAQKRDQCAARILDDNTLPHQHRDLLRVEYQVYRDLLLWPGKALQCQLALLEAAPAHEEAHDPAMLP